MSDWYSCFPILQNDKFSCYTLWILWFLWNRLFSWDYKLLLKFSRPEIFMSDVFAQVSWIACGYYHSALVTVSGLCPHHTSCLHSYISAFLPCLHVLIFACLSILIFSHLHIIKVNFGLGGSQMEGSLVWVVERAALLIVQGDQRPFISPSKVARVPSFHLPRWPESPRWWHHHSLFRHNPL